MVGIIKKTIFNRHKEMKIILGVDRVVEEEVLLEVEKVALNVEKKVICLGNVLIKKVVNKNL